MGVPRRLLLLLPLILSACTSTNRRSDSPPTWAERWQAIYEPGNDADQACHELMLALRDAVKVHHRERIHTRMVSQLQELTGARKAAETLILTARREKAPIDDTIEWEEIVQAWTGTELHVRKLIPVEILDKTSRN
ncbi:MAG: hypothetical protein ACYTFG_08800 [Planctomycetota bacterium]|jgi:hypothetical protein